MTHIAILAFGSLVNQLTSPIYQDHILQIEGTFTVLNPLELSLPIRLSRYSSQGTSNERITLVVDPHASQSRVAVALSALRNLPEAIENLRRREGTTTENICYLAKENLPGLPTNALHTITSERVTYKGKFCGSNPQYCLNSGQILKIVKWLKTSGFDAVIWTGLPPNIQTSEGTSGKRGREILPLLRDNPSLLTNTQAYIRILPDEFKTPLMHKILCNNLSD